MNNSKIIFVIILIFLFTLSFRLPLQEKYPQGYDTYTVYKLANDIKSNHYIQWIHNPLSLSGYYPISYPTGGILLLAQISSFTSLDMNTSIYLWNVILIIFAGIIIYLISMQFTKNNIISLIVVLAYLNSRFIFYYTNWFFTVRNVFLFFFLFLMWLFTREHFRHRNTLIVITLLLLAISHRMIILIPIFIIAYLLSKYLPYRIIHSKTFKYAVLIGTIALFGISFVLNPAIELSSLTEAPFHTDIRSVDQIIDFLFRYAIQTGIMLLLIPLGYFAMLRKPNKTRQEAFILIAMLLIAPLLTEPTYVFYLVLPMLAIFLGYAIALIFNTRPFREYGSKNIWKGTLIVIIILILISPLFIQILPSNEPTVVEETLALKDYLEKNAEGTIVCNEHIIYCDQITALSKNKVQSLSTSTELTKADDYNYSAIQFAPSLKQIFQIQDPLLNTQYYQGIEYGYLMTWNAKKPIADKIIQENNIRYIVDSGARDSISNRRNINKRIRYSNMIYNNGHQWVYTI